MQRGRVVDAVAKESHDVTFAAQDTNDSLLVRGREAGEECRLLCRLSQIGVGHFFDVVAQQHGVGEKPDIAAYFAANQVVVAGKDLNCNTMFAQRFDRGCSGGLGRVEECDISFNTRLCSSSFAQDVFPGNSFTATAKTRNPSLLRLAYSSFNPFIRAGSMGDNLPSNSN